MSQMDAKPNPTPLEGKPDMVAFRAEIVALANERCIGIQEAKEFIETTRKTLHEKGITGSEVDQEINRLYKIEQKKPAKKPINMVELTQVNPNELTEADADMWRKVNNYKKGSVTQLQLGEYRQNIIDSGNNFSRGNFYAVIANKLSGIWGREELEEILSHK